MMEEYIKELEERNAKLIKENVRLKIELENSTDILVKQENEKNEILTDINTLLNKIGFEINLIDSEDGEG
jgi:hypothetical protein